MISYLVSGDCDSGLHRVFVRIQHAVFGLCVPPIALEPNYKEKERCTLLIITYHIISDWQSNFAPNENAFGINRKCVFTIQIWFNLT